MKRIPRRRWIIECPARCAEKGCPAHEPGTWRKSKRLPLDTTPLQALRALHEHSRTYPKSGPYRLRLRRIIHI
jgi:hypothetical protein